MSSLPCIGIVVFPGSNCDRDCEDAALRYMGVKVKFIWHTETSLDGCDAMILPGGFSYGDYLRSGAIARFSPVMREVAAFAKQGRPVIGICNGFQVLTESGLLPGVLIRNASLRFQCRHVNLTVETTRTVLTTAYRQGQEILLPIAHADGNYQADEDTIKRLEDNNQVVFRYAEDVNGSCNQIAGVCNEAGNVVGMMPHPERNLWQQPGCENTSWTGEGAMAFDSLKQALLQAVPIGLAV